MQAQKPIKKTTGFAAAGCVNIENNQTAAEVRHEIRRDWPAFVKTNTTPNAKVQ